ncbi:hypothetical protein [Faecalibacterium prausnitzii]|uniref:hypothetical protein n=1 Tax=Faecalibacterium prausnitzii TaxID=853 RepID=UPI002666833B|nr:hypothetical protein [Faecalibacterium prausnitzii]
MDSMNDPSLELDRNWLGERRNCGRSPEGCPQQSSLDRKMYPTGRKMAPENKNLSKSFPFYITQKLSKMQGIAQKLSNKFGVLHGGKEVIFWYNS